MTPHPVEIKNLSFAYGVRPILRDVSFRAGHGEVVAIMGGSGSGKTTLLRHICGQLLPAEPDKVRIFGQDLANMPRLELYRLRRKIGMMLQFNGLFTDLSALDNVAFPMREHTRLPFPSIRDLALLKLQAVGLRGAALLHPSELSGGMARRVALARAIALDPDLILYDEPFAGLDPISLAVVAKLIRQVAEAMESCAIMVTHDVAETLAIADRIYLMWAGQIIAKGTPDEMRKSDDPRVRQFIDASPEGPLPFHYRGGEPNLARDLGLPLPPAPPAPPTPPTPSNPPASLESKPDSGTSDSVSSAPSV